MLWGAGAWGSQGPFHASSTPATPAKICRITAARGVVVAAGAWSGALLAAATATPAWGAAFAPRRGHLLELERPPGMAPLGHGLMEAAYTRHYSSSGAPDREADDAVQPGATEANARYGVTFTAAPSARGTLLLGSSREDSAGFGAGPEPGAVAAVLARAAAFLPGLVGLGPGSGIDVRVGLRPAAIASTPAVGPVPNAPGLFVAAGHEGSGLLLAPATAELVVGYVLGGSGFDGRGGLPPYAASVDPALALAAGERELAKGKG